MTSDGVPARPLAWMVGAYDRDWPSLGFVERLLDAAVKLGLVGPVASIEAGDLDSPQAVPPHQALEVPGLISSALWAQPGPKRLTARGVEPAAWELFVSWFRDGSEEPFRSVGDLTLRFGRAGGEEAEESDALWRAFRAVHDDASTTHATIEVWTRCKTCAISTVHW